MSNFFQHKNRAELEKQHIIETTCDTIDVCSDIVGIAMDNIDLLIEVKDAMDSAPQSALKVSLREMALPGTQF
jgi:hypothetical protein